MLLYLFKFLVCEGSGLVEHGGVDADLAYIVKETQHVDLVLSGIGEAESPGYHFRIYGNTVRMTLGINVFCIDRSRETAYDLQEKRLILSRLLLDLKVELLLQRNEFDKVINAHEKDFRYERLPDKVHRAKREAFALSSLALIRGKEYYRDLGSACLKGMKLPDRVKAAHSGHLYV